MGNVYGMENGERTMINNGRAHLIEQIRLGKVALRMNPQLLKLPLPIQRFDDPFLPFGKAIIGATRDIVGAYLFDLASYLALGGAGAVALERTLRYVGDDVVTILHGAFSDIAYATVADKIAFGVDFITVTTLVGESSNGILWTDGVLPRDVLTWHTPTRQLCINDLSTRVTDENFLFTGKDENFAETLRDTILQLG